MVGIGLKIWNAISKYGAKAWTAIKNGAANFYDAAKSAWDAGYWAFTKWVAANAGAVTAIYEALQAAGLID